VDNLKRHFPSYDLHQNSLEDGMRGGVVWLIPETQEDVDWFHQNAQDLLDQAFPGDFPLPVILKTTGLAHPNLFPAYLTLRVLEELPEQERQEVGIELWNFERRRQAGIIVQEMGKIRGEEQNFATLTHKLANFVLPSALWKRAHLGQYCSVKQVLEECYMISYCFHPVEFYTQHKSAGRGLNTLSKATRQISKYLLTNSLTPQSIQNLDSLEKDILQKFLISKWKILCKDFRICVPERNKAWELLEETYAPGVSNKYLRDVILKLMNPPYGYDYNTATLLLCAWIGYHRQELQLLTGSVQISASKLVDILGQSTGRQPFIGELIAQKTTISRRDTNELLSRVNIAIDRINKGTQFFSQEDAKKTIAELESNCKDSGLVESVCEAANEAVERLQNALDISLSYDEAAQQIWEDMEKDKGIASFIQLRRRIEALPSIGIVTTKCMSIEQLTYRWREKLQQLIESECARLVKVLRLQEVGVNRRELERIGALLKKEKLVSQLERVNEALNTIDQKERELEAAEAEAPVRAEIDAMSTAAPLLVLQQNKAKLEKMSGFSTGLMQLRDRRCADISAAIDNLMHFAKGLIQAVETIDEVARAEEWKQKYYRTLDKFEGTLIQTDLEEACRKIEQILEFLRHLDQIHRRQIGNLSDIDKCLTELEAVKRETQSWRTASLTNKLTQVINRLQAERKRLTIEAHEWLLEMQTTYKRGDSLAKLIRDLESKHSYLLPEDEVLLDELRENVQHAAEQDSVARIEAIFKSISDQNLQMRCIERLQAIVKNK